MVRARLYWSAFVLGLISVALWNPALYFLVSTFVEINRFCVTCKYLATRFTTFKKKDLVCLPVMYILGDGGKAAGFLSLALDCSLGLVCLPMIRIRDSSSRLNGWGQSAGLMLVDVTTPQSDQQENVVLLILLTQFKYLSTVGANVISFYIASNCWDFMFHYMLHTLPLGWIDFLILIPIIRHLLGAACAWVSYDCMV